MPLSAASIPQSNPRSKDYFAVANLVSIMSHFQSKGNNVCKIFSISIFFSSVMEK